MLSYRLLFPIIRRLPPEFAHNLAQTALRVPWSWVARPPDDPFTWKGLTFRNRVGIAAGFDKNGECLAGIERLGAGFVEIGTVLVAPWSGNQISPRMARLVPLRALWNRLGFTSRGVEFVRRKLERFPQTRRHGMVLACNIGPHPGNLKNASNRAEALTIARDELLHLIAELHHAANLVVVNLSSPNTPGLRSLLQSAGLVESVLLPLRNRSRELDARESRSCATPLLVKLPPEDENREAWTPDSLGSVLSPMVQANACDGFVAVNTSVRLAQKHYPAARSELPGGVSGDPLRPEALRVTQMVRTIIGPDRLLIGCGGIVEPEHVALFFAAGANLVELYSGMIFAGPGIVARCAIAAKEKR